MEFVETPTFTRLVLALMDDDHYARLQAALAIRPDLGKVMPGSGGSPQSKMGWERAGQTWRFADHIIYYWHVADDKIWMLLAYPKSDQDHLSRGQVRQLKILVEEFLL